MNILSQKGIMNCANSIIMLIYLFKNCTTTTNIFVDGEGLQLSIKVNMTYLAWYRKIVRSSLGKISCDEQLDSLFCFGEKFASLAKERVLLNEAHRCLQGGILKGYRKQITTNNLLNQHCIAAYPTSLSQHFS